MLNPWSTHPFSPHFLFYCSKYVNVKTEELPKVKVADMPVENTVVNADTKTPDLKCETSKDCKAATKYCLDCGRLMCDDHHQVELQQSDIVLFIYIII